eukprot:340184-Chlamydomonas_euryale.AAC.1
MPRTSLPHNPHPHTLTSSASAKNSSLACESDSPHCATHASVFTPAAVTTPVSFAASFGERAAKRAAQSSTGSCTSGRAVTP